MAHIQTLSENKTVTLTEVIETELSWKSQEASYFTVTDTHKYFIIDSWGSGFGVTSCANLNEVRRSLSENQLEMLNRTDCDEHWCTDVYDKDANEIVWEPVKVTVRFKK